MHTTLSTVPHSHLNARVVMRCIISMYVCMYVSLVSFEKGMYLLKFVYVFFNKSVCMYVLVCMYLIVCMCMCVI